MHRVRIYSNRVLGMKIRFEVAECISGAETFSPLITNETNGSLSGGRGGGGRNERIKLGSIREELKISGEGEGVFETWV